MCKDNIVSLNQIDHPGEMTFFLFFFHQGRGVKKKKKQHELNLKGEKEGWRKEPRFTVLHNDGERNEGREDESIKGE